MLALPSDARTGSLRIFGRSFGGSPDRTVRVVSVKGRADAVVLYFRDGEMLTVWEPRGLDAAGVRVQDARRVRVEWFGPGVVRTIAGRHWLDYERVAEGVTVTASVPRDQPAPRGDPDAPAVELIRR